MPSSHIKAQLQGATLVLLSGVTLSTKAILAKLAYRHGVDALTMLSLRMFFAVPLLLLSVYFAEKSSATRLTRKDLLQIALLGVTGYYISAMLDFLGLMYISAALERLVLFLYPTFVMLISAVLFRTRLRRTHMVALLITYLGMAVVFHQERALSGSDTQKGALLVLGCSVGYAAYLVGAGRLIPRVGAQRFNAYSLLSATTVILLHWTLRGSPLHGLPLPVYGYGFLMATVGTVIPTILLAKGIARIGAGPAAILTSIGPVSTVLLASTLLDEPITTGQILGGVLVLVGVTLVTTTPAQGQSPPQVRNKSSL